MQLTFKTVSLTLLAAFSVACATDVEIDSSEKELARMAGGMSESGSDLCDTHMWYGDGECDTFCVMDDPDCECADADADGYCDDETPTACDRNDVDCLALPPECGAGEVPSVVDGCWGPCVSEALCVPPDAECVDLDADGYCDDETPTACDRNDVDCLALPPECGAGEVPSVVDGCWGPCVPADHCTDV